MSDEITNEQLKNFFKTFDAVLPLVEDKCKFNAFSVIGPSEMQTSKVLAEIFKYKKNNRYPFLELFLKEILSSEEFVVGDEPSIKVEASTDKNRRIDVVIKGENFFIGIENKSNGAGDQGNQVADYYKHALNSGKIITKIIYMPITSKDPTDKSINGLDENYYKDILIMPFCNSIDDSKLKFKLLCSVADFSKECKKNTSDERMMFFLNNFIDYIENDMEENIGDEKSKVIETILDCNKEFNSITELIQEESKKDDDKSSILNVFFKDNNNYRYIYQDISNYLDIKNGVRTPIFVFSEIGLSVDDEIYLKCNDSVKAKIVSDNEIELIVDSNSSGVVMKMNPMVQYLRETNKDLELGISNNGTKCWAYNGHALKYYRDKNEKVQKK